MLAMPFMSLIALAASNALWDWE